MKIAVAKEIDPSEPRVAASPDTVKKFKAIDKASDWASAAKLIKEIPGAKVESKQKVKVEFK